MNSNKFTFKTQSFGCRINLAEEEEIQKRMYENGFTWNNIRPDIFIINSCAVTEKAEREVRQLIYKVKRDNANTFLVVTGCAVTNWLKNKVNTDLPIDLTVDNIGKSSLSELINKKYRQKKIKTDVFLSLSQHNKFVSSNRYLIKIQDGCHRFCTFCIVPYLRGSPESLKISQILNTINLLPQNIKEVILTAINTEAFGKDTGEKITELISTILNNTKIQRLSFGSIHPWSIDGDFLAFYKNEIMSRSGNSGRLVDYFHIPIQSGSDKILSLMKRDYKSAEIEDKLRQIHKINPLALVGTDIIAGFLEEKDKDFEDTFNFLKRTPINKFHIFRMSYKKGTATFFMKKSMSVVDNPKKNERSKILIELGRKKMYIFQKSHIGQVFSCLLIKKVEDDIFEGLLSNQMSVLVKITHKKNRPVVDVKVMEFKNDKLIGKIVN